MQSSAFLPDANGKKSHNSVHCGKYVSVSGYGIRNQLCDVKTHFSSGGQRMRGNCGYRQLYQK